jgi:ABC-type polysaccharide/polyol phosphate transport system ATPase subunit
MTDPAIRIEGVTKRYPLYDSTFSQALGYLGLSRARRHKTALDHLDLTIQRGEKVGIIGRNGSGKTTLLRLVIGHTRVTEGRVEADGTVQALMQTGFGFNDHMSGLENIENSLIYNGLSRAQREAALADIREFVELDGFLDHPIKTYSLGMRTRLEFATATAIHPAILAIDEVLGAGDGYFVQKSAARMRRVIGDSTLLLVSHSLSQVRQYCDRVVWLDGGRIVEDGPVDPVIRSYQRFMVQHEARVNEEIYQRLEALPGQSDGLGGKARDALVRARTLFGVSDSEADAVRITGCRIDGADDGRLVLETGEPLTVRLSARAAVPATLEPVLVGLSEHGAFVFEAVGPEVKMDGSTELELHHPRAGIGVGNYFLIPALRWPSDRRLATIGPMVWTLRVLPTNWSDPPLIHLDARWHGGIEGRPIESKVSAWV